MKKILLLLILFFQLTFSFASTMRVNVYFYSDVSEGALTWVNDFYKPEHNTICVQVTDAKTNQPISNCKITLKLSIYTFENNYTNVFSEESPGLYICPYNIKNIVPFRSFIGKSYYQITVEKIGYSNKTISGVFAIHDLTSFLKDPPENFWIIANLNDPYRQGSHYGQGYYNNVLYQSLRLFTTEDASKNYPLYGVFLPYSSGYYLVPSSWLDYSNAAKMNTISGMLGHYVHQTKDFSFLAEKYIQISRVMVMETILTEVQSALLSAFNSLVSIASTGGTATPFVVVGVAKGFSEFLLGATINPNTTLKAYMLGRIHSIYSRASDSAIQIVQQLNQIHPFPNDYWTYKQASNFYSKYKYVAIEPKEAASICKDILLLDNYWTNALKEEVLKLGKNPGIDAVKSFNDFLISHQKYEEILSNNSKLRFAFYNTYEQSWVKNGIGYQLFKYYGGKSVKKQDIFGPLKIKKLTVQYKNGKYYLNWVAPSPNMGTLKRYVIKYSKAPITEDNWQKAYYLTIKETNSAAGSDETIEFSNLPKDLYFAIKSVDNSENISPVSVMTRITGSAPIADFTANQTTGTAPLTVNFTDQSTNSPTAWAWDFGDGSTSPQQSPSHSYQSAGTYTVKLTATNQYGSNTKTRSNYITVSSPGSAPIADFTANPITGTAPLTVNFTDQSSNSPTSWLWDFGDGSTSPQQSPSHSYKSAGTYTVKLTATNQYGSNTKTMSNYITVNSPGSAPIADFTANPITGTAPLTVNFTDQSTNSPTSWLWDFGDGFTSPYQNTSHTYQNTGTYTVKLTATNQYGSNTKTITDYINVTGSDNTNPILWQDNFDNDNLNNFPANWTASGNGSTSYVTNSNSYSSPNSLSIQGISGGNWEGLVHRKFDNNYKHYQFEFTYLFTGQGSVGYHQSHGGFYITSNPNWKTDYSRGFINFQPNMDIICYPSLTVIGNYSINKWVRIKLDYQILTDSVIIKYYINNQFVHEEEDNIRVGDSNLKYITFKSGDTRCLIDDIIVRAITSTGTPPTAGFIANPTTGTAPLSVNFTDQSTNSPTSWQWNFGDGNTSTEKNPTHTYSSVGSYTVSLTATNSDGTDTKTKTDYITVSDGGGGGTPPTGYFTDPRDGQKYGYIEIGSQTWMAENLNYDTTNSWWYDNSSANGDIYGRLYTWDAALHACPSGWHLPGENEWKTLFNVLGGESSAGGKMKETGTAHWSYPNSGASDSVGFKALPGGIELNGKFYNIGDWGYWWSSTSDSYPTQASSVALLNNSKGASMGTSPKSLGCSVRCLKDANENRPIADFTATPTSGTAPLTVNFTDQSTNNPTAWAWDFGDDNTSTEKNPTHTYSSIGSYTVSLTATNSDGSDTKTKSDYISVSDGGGGGTPPTGYFTDPRDGQKYGYIEIGSQTWMAENLNYDTTNSWWYGNSSANGDIYGRLYTWDAALHACPSGWHLPSDDEWKTLEMALGMSQSEADADGWRGTDESEKMKSTSGWNSNGNGTNSSGFNALPGGYHYSNGFDYLGDVGDWWSSTVNSGTFAWSRTLYYDYGRVYRVYINSNKTNGFSVRCLKDANENRPVADFTATPTSGTAPLTVNFTDQSTNNPTSWLWDFGDGDTSSQQSPSHTFQSAENYTVSLTAINNYGSDKKTKTNYIQATTSGVHNNKMEKSITIYPNPTKSELYIGFKDISFNDITVSIYDSYGKLLFNQHYNKTPLKTIKLSLLNYNNGVYYIRFKTNKGTLTKKFIVML